MPPGSGAARIWSRPDPEPSFLAGTEADLSNLVDLRYHITKTLSLGNTVSGHMCCKLYFYLSSIQEQCKLNVFLHTVSTYSRCTKMLTCRYPYIALQNLNFAHTILSIAIEPSGAGGLEVISNGVCTVYTIRN